MKRTFLLTLAALSLAVRIHAQTTLQFTANLSGTNEVPPNGSTYVGSGTFTLTGNTLEYSVGMLSPFFYPTSAGIYGPGGEAHKARLLFDLGSYGIVAPYNGFPGALGYIGSLILTHQQVKDLKAGRLYVNFTSSSYPKGEIRGRIVTAASIDDLCPCNGPWRNHGEYMKCVKAIATEFAQEGLITESEKREIVKQAEKSDCGKRSR